MNIASKTKQKQVPRTATHWNGKRTFYKWSDRDGLFKWFKNEWIWISYFKEDYLKALVKK